MDAYQMLFAHKYAEAAAAYKAELDQAPGDMASLDGLATAFLCLGRLNEGLIALQQVNENETKSSKGKSQPYLAEIGTILWLLGRRSEAIEKFRIAARLIRDGVIEFVDVAGGISEGLLLWYAGVSANDRAAREEAEAYLRSKLGNHPWIRNMPGPLAFFVLGDKSFEETVASSFGTADLEELTEQARTDLLKRRHLVKAIFYLATRRRFEGNESECRRLMRKCMSLENPILEPEWYLARGESMNQG